MTVESAECGIKVYEDVRNVGYNAQLAKVSAITTTIKSLPSGFTLGKFQLPDYSSKAS